MNIKINEICKICGKSVIKGILVVPAKYLVNAGIEEHQMYHTKCHKIYLTKKNHE